MKFRTQKINGKEIPYKVTGKVDEKGNFIYYCNKHGEVEIVERPIYTAPHQSNVTGEWGNSTNTPGLLSCGCKVYHGEFDHDTLIIEKKKWRKINDVFDFAKKTESSIFLDAFNSINQENMEEVINLFPLIREGKEEERSKEYIFARYSLPSGGFSEYVYSRTSNYSQFLNVYGTTEEIEVLGNLEFENNLDNIINENFDDITLGKYVIKVEEILYRDLHRDTSRNGDLMG